MYSTNFDYFVSRGTILNEMARPAKGLGIKSPTLVGVYGRLRTEIKSRDPTLLPTPIQLKAFLYLYKLSDEVGAFDEVQQELYMSSKTGRMLIVPLIVTLINQSLDNGTFDEQKQQKVAELAQDPEKLDNFLVVKDTNKGNRSLGGDKAFERVTEVPKKEYVKTAVGIAPLLAELNRLQGIRKHQKRPPQGVSAQPQQESEPSNPNLQIAKDILDILGAVSSARSKLRANEDLYDVEPKSVWAAKTPQNDLNSIIKRIPDKVFDATIETLSNLIEAKIDAGTGQSAEGFLKLVDRLKQSPSTPPALVALFDYIVDRLADEESKTIEELEQDFSIEGYDPDILEKVLDTPEDKETFKNWVQTKRKWREELDNIAIRRYEDNISNLASLLKGASGGQPPEDKENAMEVLRKRHQNLLLKKGPPPPKPPVKESVESYMEEQIQRDSKFGPPNLKLLDKGYKRFKNYNHWITANE
jgi:hypothetical protein